MECLRFAAELIEYEQYAIDNPDKPENVEWAQKLYEIWLALYEKFLLENVSASTGNNAHHQDRSSRGYPDWLINLAGKLSSGCLTNIDSSKIIEDAVAMVQARVEFDVRRELEVKGIKFANAPNKGILGRLWRRLLGVCFYRDKIILPDNASVAAIAHEIYAALNPDCKHKDNLFSLENMPLISHAIPYEVQTPNGPMFEAKRINADGNPVFIRTNLPDSTSLMSHSNVDFGNKLYASKKYS